MIKYLKYVNKERSEALSIPYVGGPATACPYCGHNSLLAAQDSTYSYIRYYCIHCRINKNFMQLKMAADNVTADEALDSLYFITGGNEPIQRSDIAKFKAMSALEDRVQESLVKWRERLLSDFHVYIDAMVSAGMFYGRDSSAVDRIYDFGIGVATKEEMSGFSGVLDTSNSLSHAYHAYLIIPFYDIYSRPVGWSRIGVSTMSRQSYVDASSVGTDMLILSKSPFAGLTNLPSAYDSQHRNVIALNVTTAVPAIVLQRLISATDVPIVGFSELTHSDAWSFLGDKQIVIVTREVTPYVMSTAVKHSAKLLVASNVPKINSPDFGRLMSSPRLSHVLSEQAVPWYQAMATALGRMSVMSAAALCYEITLTPAEAQLVVNATSAAKIKDVLKKAYAPTSVGSVVVYGSKTIVHSDAGMRIEHDNGKSEPMFDGTVESIYLDVPKLDDRAEVQVKSRVNLSLSVGESRTPISVNVTASEAEDNLSSHIISQSIINNVSPVPVIPKQYSKNLYNVMCSVKKPETREFIPASRRYADGIIAFPRFSVVKGKLRPNCGTARYTEIPCDGLVPRVINPELTESLFYDNASSLLPWIIATAVTINCDKNYAGHNMHGIAIQSQPGLIGAITSLSERLGSRVMTMADMTKLTDIFSPGFMPYIVDATTSSRFEIETFISNFDAGVCILVDDFKAWDTVSYAGWMLVRKTKDELTEIEANVADIILPTVAKISEGCQLWKKLTVKAVITSLLDNANCARCVTPESRRYIVSEVDRRMAGDVRGSTFARFKGLKAMLAAVVKDKTLKVDGSTSVTVNIGRAVKQFNMLACGEKIAEAHVMTDLKVLGINVSVTKGRIAIAKAEFDSLLTEFVAML